MSWNFGRVSFGNRSAFPNEERSEMPLLLARIGSRATEEG